MAQRAVIYSRQSKEHTEGVARQLERSGKLAAARGYTVVREYAENGTSATKQRGKNSAWAKMLADLAAGVADVVVAVDLDRLLRSQRDLIALLETGAKVVTVDGEIDLTTADGEFRATLLAALARFEVQRKGERQKRANESRASKGHPNPGRRRYGYETDGITPREPEAGIVRQLFKRIADGGTLYGSVQWLLAEAVDPAPGKVWSTRRLRDMLQNPFYVGDAVHKGVRTPSPTIRPLVDREIFDEVQAIITDPTRRTSPGPVPRHLLSGIAQCNICGSRLFFQTGGYRCLASTAHPNMRKDRLEPLIRAEIARALLTGGELFPPVDGPTIVTLRDEYDRNVRAVENIMADREDGLIPNEVARERLRTLKSERERIEAELNATRSQKAAGNSLHDLALELLPDGVVPMSDYSAAADDLLERFDAFELEKRREIVRALLHIELLPGKDERGQPIAPTRRVYVEHLLATHLNPA